MRKLDITTKTSLESKCSRNEGSQKNFGKDATRQNKERSYKNQSSPITGKVAEKQLKWYGHVRRMDETRKPKQYMEARPEGRRQKGRQRTTYADVIEHLGMEGREGKL